MNRPRTGDRIMTRRTEEKQHQLSDPRRGEFTENELDTKSQISTSSNRHRLVLHRRSRWSCRSTVRSRRFWYFCLKSTRKIIRSDAPGFSTPPVKKMLTLDVQLH